jgi:magnesium transporter
MRGNLEDIEDAVFDEKIAIIKEISYLRRYNGTLRRAIIPLRTTVLEIADDIARFAEEDLRPYFNDVKDHLNKIFEILEQTNDTIEMYKDANAQLSTERTNKILTLLTILSTLGLPFTIIGTVYGMIINQLGAIKIDSSSFFGIPITIIIGIIDLL